MKILSIETATEACSAALYIDGQVIERFEVCPRLHTQKLLKMCDEILKETGTQLSQLDGIAYGKGPGSFTGVRLAVSVAQGLGFGANIPVVPVSTLEALALGAFKQTSQTDVIITAMDARMDEVYACAYQVEEGKLKPLLDEQLLSHTQAWPTLALEPGLNILGCGHGFRAYPGLKDKIGCALVDVIPELLPHAAEIAILAKIQIEAGLGKKAGDCYADYLRNKVVHT